MSQAVVGPCDKNAQALHAALRRCTCVLLAVMWSLCGLHNKLHNDLHNGLHDGLHNGCALHAEQQKLFGGRRMICLLQIAPGARQGSLERVAAQIQAVELQCHHVICQQSIASLL